MIERTFIALFALQVWLGAALAFDQWVMAERPDTPMWGRAVGWGISPIAIGYEANRLAFERAGAN